ncbi:hypothetical protein Hanom_Chr11g00999931 [Helianthus anomalus]
MCLFCTHLILFRPAASSPCVLHAWFSFSELVDFELGLTLLALALNFRYEAVKGALVQSVFTRPPWVAQSSAFHKLAYTLIGWLLGKGTPAASWLLNTLTGMLSIKKLQQEDLPGDQYSVMW